MPRMRPRSIAPDKAHICASAALGPQPDSIVLAEMLGDRGMAAPVSLMLQACRPLAWVGSQMAWMLEPFVRMGLRSRGGVLTLPALARLLEDEQGVKDLIEELNSYSRQTRSDGHQ